MKNNYKSILKASNAVEPAASVKRKGVPGKGGKTLNATIPDWMFQRELEDMKEGKQDA